MMVGHPVRGTNRREQHGKIAKSSGVGVVFVLRTGHGDESF
jgi:hypothetical protein